MNGFSAWVGPWGSYRVFLWVLMHRLQVGKAIWVSRKIFFFTQALAIMEDRRVWSASMFKMRLIRLYRPVGREYDDAIKSRY